MDTEKYNQLKSILYNDLFIGVPASDDMGDRIALIAMICYLTNVLQKKKPGITYSDVIKLCMKSEDYPYLDQEQLQILSLVCEWFAGDCKKFPNLGVKVAEMPSKIENLISSLLPF